MDKFKELKALIESLEEDAIKTFEKDTKAAGVRLRKGLQEIKSLAQELRVLVSESKKKD